MTRCRTATTRPTNRRHSTMISRLPSPPRSPRQRRSVNVCAYMLVNLSAVLNSRATRVGSAGKPNPVRTKLPRLSRPGNEPPPFHTHTPRPASLLADRTMPRQKTTRRQAAAAAAAGWSRRATTMRATAPTAPLRDTWRCAGHCLAGGRRRRIGGRHRSWRGRGRGRSARRLARRRRSWCRSRGRARRRASIAAAGGSVLPPNVTPTTRRSSRNRGMRCERWSDDGDDDGDDDENKIKNFFGSVPPTRTF